MSVHNSRRHSSACRVEGSGEPRTDPRAGHEATSQPADAYQVASLSGPASGALGPGVALAAERWSPPPVCVLAPPLEPFSLPLRVHVVAARHVEHLAAEITTRDPPAYPNSQVHLQPGRECAQSYERDHSAGRTAQDQLRRHHRRQHILRRVIQTPCSCPCTWSSCGRSGKKSKPRSSGSSDGCSMARPAPAVAAQDSTGVRRRAIPRTQQRPIPVTSSSRLLVRLGYVDRERRTSGEGR